MYRQNQDLILDSQKCCNFVKDCCAAGLNKKATSHGRLIIHKTPTTVNSERLTTELVPYIVPAQCLAPSDSEAGRISSACFSCYAHG